jgi:hypothetical protein
LPAKHWLNKINFSANDKHSIVYCEVKQLSLELVEIGVFSFVQNQNIDWLFKAIERILAPFIQIKKQELL